MAAYLSLRHKKTGVLYSGGALVQVDDMLCAHLGVEPDSVQWCEGWMDWIGFAIAYRSDKSVAEALAPMRKNARANERQIIDWFVSTFENESYHGR